MCGRFSLSLPPAALEAQFDAAPPADLEPRYNCAPGQSLPIIANDDTERIRRAKWGFTPSWAEESFDLVNARVETVREKRSFADAYEARRCLVPADGFYEWQPRGGGKQPYRVTFADDRPFAMAGIYETWKPPTRQSGIDEFGSGRETSDERIEAFTVLTTEPNELVSELHDRMAVVLHPENEQAWLDGDLDHHTLARPFSDGDLRSYPVSTRVNSPANDDPSLVEPVESKS